MSQKSTSLVKSTSAISVVDPILIIKSITDTINSVSKTVDKYFDYKIAKEETTRQKFALKTELKKAKIQLEAFDKSLKFNIKFLNKQSDDIIKYRESVREQTEQFKNIYTFLEKVYTELALRENVDKETLNIVGNKLTEINAKHIEIIKLLRPASFATIDK